MKKSLTIFEIAAAGNDHSDSVAGTYGCIALFEKNDNNPVII